MSGTWHLHQKTSSGQRCPASPASASSTRAAASGAFSPFPSSHPLGGLVTLSASPSLDKLATEPPGHGGSPTRFTTCRDAFTPLACRASALAHDLAPTARTQWATTWRLACRDYRLWTLNGVCPGPGFGSLELTARSRRSSSSTWILPSRGSV